MERITAWFQKVIAWLTPKRVLVIGCVLILIAPAIMVLPLGWIVFGGATGPIGDTIGGITSPITGLVGAFLVYKALQAQIEANRLVNEQFKIQRAEANQERVVTNLLERIKFIRDEINGFSVTGLKTQLPAMDHIPAKEVIITYTGMEAIGYVFYNHKKVREPMSIKFMAAHIKHIENIVNRIHVLVFRIELDETFTWDEKNTLSAFVEGIYQPFLPYVYDNRHQLPVTLLKAIRETNSALGWLDENKIFDTPPV